MEQLLKTHLEKVKPFNSSKVGMLYKYFSFERIDDVFFHNRVRFSQLSVLNDVFEGEFPHIPECYAAPMLLNQQDHKRLRWALFLPVFEKLALQLEALNLPLQIGGSVIPSSKREILNALEQIFLSKNIEGFSDQIIPLVQEISELTKNNIVIFCLSKSYKNDRMWAQYAANNEGFVLEFDVRHPFFSSSKYRNIGEVRYTKKRTDSVVQNALYQPFLLFKSMWWKDEQEVRILARPEDADKIETRNKESFYFFTLPKECIRSVLLGSRMTHENIGRIKTYLKQQEFVHVELYQMIPSKRAYDLEKRRIH